MKRLKVLITGHKGMLGTDLMTACASSFVPVGLDLPEFDITKRDNCLKAIGDLRPDLLIHAAAYTDVDGCEKYPEKALSVNAEGTANVAGTCDKLKIPMMYISTDFVFDGKKRSPYREEDLCHPIQVYGRSKLIGEFYVRDLLSKFFIVRTSWLFGKHGKNFPESILKQARQKKELRVVTDQIGSPTLTEDLCRAIMEIFKNGGYGIYHAANRGATSWFKFAVSVLKEAGKDNPILPITSAQLKRPAKRPAYSVLKNSILEDSLKFQMPDWQDALKRYLNSYRVG